MKEKLKIAVISDLHCTYNSKTDPVEANTYLISNLMRIPADHNPVEALKKIINQENLEADLLLCPGDITDKTNSQGLITGWQHLEDLKIRFGARVLAATVGNHDVDSRHTQSQDPLHLIKSLSPNFPTDNNANNDRFWARNYCIINDEECDILIFNSSFSHVDKDTCNQSHISHTTLSQIKESLEEIKGNGRLKIALCHHHPLKHSNTTYTDADSIDKGEELIDLLNLFGFSLVIHGHKHDPRITNYNSLPVFCAGSFASIANLIDLKADNTFHFIEIDKTTKEGIIQSWVYGPQYGWQQRDGTYFPCHTGFGAHIDINQYSMDCINFIKAQTTDTISYEALVNQFPKIVHLIPSEQTKLNTIFKNNSIEFLPQLPNLPKLISKQYH
jgi:predicted phosphodiesterase